MTLKTLARMANVSVSTASRALNDSYGVSPETRELVLQLAKEHGYFQKKKQVRIENRRNKRINVAIICPEIISGFFSGVASAFVKEIRSRSSDCTLFYHDFDLSKKNDILDHCFEDDRYSAIIVLSGIFQKPEYVNVPVICTGGISEFSHLNFEYDLAVEAALDYIKSKGITSVAFLGESLTTRKARFFTELAQSRGLAHTSYSSPARFEEAGVDCVKKLLESPRLPQCLLCAYDEIAFGAIHALTESGLSIPEDIGVMGINDVSGAKYFHGGLTTVSISFTSTVKKVIDDIFITLESGTFTPTDYNAQIRVIPRKTL